MHWEAIAFGCLSALVVAHVLLGDNRWLTGQVLEHGSAEWLTVSRLGVGYLLLASFAVMTGDILVVARDCVQLRESSLSHRLGIELGLLGIWYGIFLVTYKYTIARAHKANRRLGPTNFKAK